MAGNVAAVRALLRSAEDRLGVRRSGSISSASASLAVPEGWRAAFPYGLPIAGVLSVGGVQVEIVQALLAGLASRQGAWVACLGGPRYSWSFLQACGIAADRFVQLPHLSAVTAMNLLSVAVRGFGVVLSFHLPLSSAQQYVLSRQAQQSGSLLIASEWERPLMRVNCSVMGVQGLDRGAGHLSRIDYLLDSPYGELRLGYSASGWEPIHTELRAVQ